MRNGTLIWAGKVLYYSVRAGAGESCRLLRWIIQVVWTREKWGKKGPPEVGFLLAFWTLGEVGIWAKIAITYCHRDS